MRKAFQLTLVAGILASLTLVWELTQAQTIPLNNSSTVEKLQFILPSSARQQSGQGEGRPPRRTSGGSRSELCSQQIVALVPGQGTIELQASNCNNESESLLGLTLAATPTYWFYIPQQSASQISGEFFLMEGDRLIHKEKIQLSPTSGVISFIPNFPLEINKLYRWSFVVQVDPQKPWQNRFVQGLVQRIEPNISLRESLKTGKSKRDRIAIYARHGIWHEAVTELGILYRNAPQNSNWQNDWFDLLTSVGLGAIAEVPLVDCCN